MSVSLTSMRCTQRTGRHAARFRTLRPRDFCHIVAGVYSPWNARFSQIKMRRPMVTLSRKLLSRLFLKPMAKRHPSKPELKSITPNMRTPPLIRLIPPARRQSGESLADFDQLFHHREMGNGFVGCKPLLCGDLQVSTVQPTDRLASVGGCNVRSRTESQP